MAFPFQNSIARAETETNENVRGEYGLNNPIVGGASGTVKWDCIYFGHYWQRAGTKEDKTLIDPEKEKIKWRVLSVDGDDAFLMADSILTHQGGFETDQTWEDSSVRNWLNGYGEKYEEDRFLKDAFSSEERNAIRKVSVINEDNPEDGTKGGEDTKDKIYLLSYKEVCNGEYGFNEDFYQPSDTRITETVPYYRWKNYPSLYDPSTSYQNLLGQWLLRTPCKNGSLAINPKGYGSAYYISAGVRPVLHLDLSKTDLWSYAGTVNCTGGTVTHSENSGLQNPSVSSQGNVIWDCVYFGNYQHSMTTSGGAFVKTPIKWRVLSVEGNDAFLMADYNIDVQTYGGVHWKSCGLRSWLNGYDATCNQLEEDFRSDNFIDSAFNEEEKSAIIQTNVKYQGNPEKGRSGEKYMNGVVTKDKIFVLSWQEMCNPLYGFNAENCESTTRKSKITTYVSKKQKSDTNTSWLIRTPEYVCDSGGK